MTTESTLPSRLRWAREQAGLSQGQVAKMLGVHRPTISSIESGERAVKAEEIVFFAETYDINTEWILRGNAAIPEDETMQMVARKLSKLSAEDLNKVLQVVKTLRRREGQDV